MTWAGFSAIPNGTRVLNHSYDQCVALANLYHERVLGKPFVAVNSAYQWWTSYHVMPALYNTYRQTQTPVAGGVVVSRYGIYNGIDGHIEVITSVNPDGSFNTMGQNASGHRYVWRYRRTMQNVLGILEPYSNPAAQTPSKPNHSKKDNDLLIRDQNNTIFVADDMGYDSILEFGAGMANEELIYAAKMLWGDTVGVNNRQRDIINAVARNRWNKKAHEIASRVPKPAFDTKSIIKAIEDAIKAQGVSVEVDAKAIAAEVEKTLADDFADIPKNIGKALQ